MDSLLKQQLHQLVDDCDNELLLEEAKTILKDNSVKDWWDELTEEEQGSVLRSEQQYKKGEFTTHAQLMQEFEAL